MSTTSAPAPEKKQDRSTVPTVALLVACAVSAYGFRAESDLLRWMVPAALVAAALLWALWPRRTGAGANDASA
jgi:hypothetical protein